jgi:hypothetical protein
MNVLSDRFVSPSPFACRVWGCRWPAKWVDEGDRGVGVGWCDDHQWFAVKKTPLTIYGHEGEGWLVWPPSPYFHKAMRDHEAWLLDRMGVLTCSV